MISPADSLRVAVALVALKHKPPSQSIPSCVLDLQATFTPAPTELSIQHPIDRLWRARAMELESECVTLRAQLEAETREKNVAVAIATAVPVDGRSETRPMSSSTEPANSNPHSQHDSQAGKKKQKKKQSAQQQQQANSSVASSIQSEALECAKQLLTSQSMRSPMVAVDQLFAVCSAVASKRGKKKDLVASSFVPAVEAISWELGSAVASGITLESLKAFDVYTTVLKHAVREAIPLVCPGPLRSSKVPETDSGTTSTKAKVATSKHLERCLRVLSKRILLPCLQSFVPLSVHFLQDLRERRAKEDGRYPILSLVQTILKALFSFQPSLTLESLRMSLILDTLTELKQTLFSNSLSPDDSEGYGHRIWDLWLSGCPIARSSAAASPASASALPDYENHLAKKDGVWFVCTILHSLSSFDGLNELVLRSRSDGEKDGVTKAGWDVTHDKMRQAVVDEILKLLSKCREVLAIASHRSGFASSPNATTKTSSDSQPPAKPTESSQDVSHAIQASAPGQEAESHTSEGERGVLGRGRKWRVDEAEYEMVLATSERLLLVYTA